MPPVFSWASWLFLCHCRNKNMVNRKRIMFVFGTRPEAIKMAPVIKEVEKYPDMLEPVVVVTGQHRQLLDQVMRIFDLDPDYDLGIMEENQTIGNIVTKSLQGLEEIILREKPDMLLVQGDTSTTFSAPLPSFYYPRPPPRPLWRRRCPHSPTAPRAAMSRPACALSTSGGPIRKR